MGTHRQRRNARPKFIDTHISLVSVLPCGDLQNFLRQEGSSELPSTTRGCNQNTHIRPLTVLPSQSAPELDFETVNGGPRVAIGDDIHRSLLIVPPSQCAPEVDSNSVIEGSRVAIRDTHISRLILPPSESPPESGLQDSHYSLVGGPPIKFCWLDNFLLDSKKNGL